MKVRLPVTGMFAAALFACSGGAKPPHNERYFRENSSARADMMKRCAKDQNSENPLECMAAENAEATVATLRSIERD